jgi:hypothetical protein
MHPFFRGKCVVTRFLVHSHTRHVHCQSRGKVVSVFLKVELDEKFVARQLVWLEVCSSSLLVHPKGGRLEGARVVTSYMGVVPGYVRSFRYDRASWCWGVGGRWWQPYPLLRLGKVCKIPHVRIWCRSSKRWNDPNSTRDGTFSLVSGVLALSPNHASCVTLTCMNRCL